VTIELDKYHPTVEAKQYLATLGPLPTAAELVGPLLAPLMAIWELTDRVESFVELLEHHEFIEVTDDERQGAADLLALLHRLGDLLGTELDDRTTPREARPSGPLRCALNLALGTEPLARAGVEDELRRLHGQGGRGAKLAHPDGVRA